MLNAPHFKTPTSYSFTGWKCYLYATRWWCNISLQIQRKNLIYILKDGIFFEFIDDLKKVGPQENIW